MSFLPRGTLAEQESSSRSSTDTSLDPRYKPSPVAGMTQNAQDLITPLLPFLADGNLTAAISELESHASSTARTVPVESIHLMAGRLAYKSGDLSRALGHFEQAVQKSFPLSDHAHLWLARTLNRMERFREATLTLTLSHQGRGEKELATASPLENDFFWETVRARIGLKEWEEALRLIGSRNVEKTEDPDDDILAEFFEGLILWNQGSTSEAASVWKKILLKNARHPLEGEILERFASKTVNPLSRFSRADWLERADNLADRGFPTEALEVIRRLELTGHNVPWPRARLTFRARRYTEAASLFEELMSDPKAGTDRGGIRSLLATSYVRSDQLDKAIALHEKIIADDPASAAARQSQQKLPAILFDAGLYDRAREVFSKILQKNPRDDRTRWLRFWSSYLLDDFSAALDDLGPLETLSRSKDALAKIRYWKGRSVDRLGRKEEAKKIFASLGNNQSSPFYASLARHRLSNTLLNTQTLIALNTTPDTLSPVIPTPSEEMGRGSNTGTIGQRTSFNDNLISPDDPLHRAFLLAQIGMSREAYEESERSPLLAAQWEPTQIIPLFGRAHNFKQVSAWGSLFAKNRTDRPPDESTIVNRLIYPPAYEEWTRFFAERYQVDERLVWSMMKQESSFKPAVTSPALAHGLMQIIPETGLAIAKELKKTNFQPEDLKDPLTSIEFGTWYVRKLLETFDGSVIHTVAAYNAGPEAVTRWLRWSQNLELDEFIELIPYPETGEYVKRVMKNYWKYIELYGSPSPPCLSAGCVEEGEGGGEGELTTRP